MHIHDLLSLSSWAAALIARVRRRPYLVTQHVGLVAHPSAVLRGVHLTIGAWSFAAPSGSSRSTTTCASPWPILSDGALGGLLEVSTAPGGGSSQLGFLLKQADSLLSMRSSAASRFFRDLDPRGLARQATATTSTGKCSKQSLGMTPNPATRTSRPRVIRQPTPRQSCGLSEDCLCRVSDSGI